MAEVDTRKRSGDHGRAAPIRVLIVEDMAFEADLTERQLRGSGVEHVMRRVETEDGMRSALREFAPDIILSDFSLPRFDGLAALDVARQYCPQVPFLFVSGTIGEERAIEALHRGAVDYVLKSNLARLGPAVRRALDEAAAHEVRRRQELQIAHLTGVLKMLSGINSAVVRIRDRNELLREACRLAVTVGGYRTAAVALTKPRTRKPAPVAWSGCDPDDAAALCALAAERRTRGAPADRAVIALPLTIDRTPIGSLVFDKGEGAGEVGEEELRMLREVAANLSFALQYLQTDTRVRWLSYFDVLTGLANRTLFCERLGRRLRGAGASQAVAVVDIENLSAVNDSFGRHAGDLLLQLVADRLKHSFPDSELLAHFSAGKYAVVQPAAAGSQTRLDALAAHLEGVFSRPFELEGNEVPVAARSGVALYPEDGAEPEALVQRAEAALRNTKSSGERHGQYSAERHSAVLARAALERKLRIALDREQFELHYQPKVDVKTRRIEGVEALIRWNDPDARLVSPAAFLPVLESSGLIVDVGNWVIQQAAADCREWQRLGLAPVRVAVNISPTQLREVDFVERFLACHQGWTSESCGLDVEITEGALADESSAEVHRLKMLRAAGINIAIDDFGTGYSSLSRLAHLPIDTLKIDRSFISRMIDDPRGKKLVSIIVSIARAFRMKVVAEGVETQDQLDALWQLGCDQSQGYLHSRPVARQQFAELLERGAGRYILPKERQPGAGQEADVGGSGGRS